MSLCLDIYIYVERNIYIYIFLGICEDGGFLCAAALYGPSVSVNETNTPVFGGAAVFVLLEIKAHALLVPWPWEFPMGR